MNFRTLHLFAAKLQNNFCLKSFVSSSHIQARMFIFNLEMKMKQIITLNLFLATCLLGLSQPPQMPEGEAGTDYNLTDSKGDKDGQWVRVYPKGSIYYLGQFEKGTPTGIFYFYYEEGGLMSVVDHLEGSAYMLVKAYNPRGEMISEGHYRESKQDGEIIKAKDGLWKFYENQALKSEEEFLLNVQHGTYKVYYSNGKVAEEAIYRNGEKDGPWRQYFESGKLRGEGDSSKGHFEGKVTYYHPNGVKLIEGKYVRGLKDGTWIKFTSSGEIEVVSSFAMGELKAERCENGVFMKYYANGIPESEYEYVNGKKDGPFTEWYEKGEFVQVPMDKPKPGGGIQFKQKLQGDQIKREGDYMNGELEGEITYYNEDGKIIKVETYENGELISTSN